MKYIRLSGIGFATWPETDELWHAHVGNAARREGCEIVSAGFVAIRNGVVHCHGRSESLSIGSRPDESAALAQQLGLKS